MQNSEFVYRDYHPQIFQVASKRTTDRLSRVTPLSPQLTGSADTSPRTRLDIYSHIYIQGSLKLESGGRTSNTEMYIKCHINKIIVINRKNNILLQERVNT